jgi:hypothetical protein
MAGVAYEPLAGWVQVTRVIATGKVRWQRLHGNRACAEASVRKDLARNSTGEATLESYLDRRPGEVQAGSQGTGRRR